MLKKNWKDILKFLSGAFFVSSGVNLYLYGNHIAVPFFGHIWSPEFLGIRGLIHFALFLLCFYFGFIKKNKAV